MAFSKFANAAVAKPAISMAAWDEVRAKAMAGSAFANRAAQSQMLLQKFNPQQYMLSHCTIIASVDVDSGPGPLGRSVEGNFQIDRRYSDYYITPATSKYVNNNQDSWERKLLLGTFRTFIGGQNYVEHLQIPEMSKGRIIDAAARDIGDSIYVDILVATELKHRPLISAIRSKQLSTLSMGCFVPGTQVTMHDGRRLPIEDVVPGDLVLTHKGRVREVANQQIRIGRWGMKQIEAVGVSSTITSTNNHPFFVLRSQETCACGCGEVLKKKDQAPTRRLGKRFALGHQLRLRNPMKVYSLEEERAIREKLEVLNRPQVVEVRADELHVGDYLCFPRTHVASSTTTEGKARLLGYFLAEGSYLKCNGTRTEVQFNFSLKEKETYAAEVVSLLAQEFPEANPAWIQERPDRNTCTVHVTGGGTPDWFFTHGGEYSQTKHLSEEVLAWSVDNLKHLVGAWINGDGSYGKSNGTLAGVTTSYALACQMHLVLARCGIFSRMECRYEGLSSSIQEAVNGGVSLRGSDGKLASFTLPISGHFAQHLSQSSSKVGPNTRKQNLRVLDDYTVFPITSIRSVGYEGPVYDLEVEEDHSYLVEGVAVHNCTVAYTMCSKCGNVAEDETQLCPHIRYMKGNSFIDGLGKVRKIAELCGHHTDLQSVKFIEASWVANPAFTGAVLRDILTPEELASVGDRMQVAFSMPAPVADPSLRAKAARDTGLYQTNEATRSKEALEALLDQIPLNETQRVVREIQTPHHFHTVLGQQGEEQFEGAGDSTPKKPPAGGDDPLNKAVDDLADILKEKALEKVRGEITKKEVTPRSDLSENENNNLVHQASRSPHWRSIARVVLSKVQDRTLAGRIVTGLMLFKSGGWRAVREANSYSGREVLAISRFLDEFQGSMIAGETRVYRTVLAVGGASPYGDVDSYLAACRRFFGRELTTSERDALITKGRIFDLGVS